MKLVRLLSVLSLIVALVAGLNQAGIHVPGLTWVRADGLTSALGLKISATTNASKANVDVGSSVGMAPVASKAAVVDGSPAAPVVVALVSLEDVPVYLRGVGAARAPQTVVVKPQVDGKLLKVYFREGQEVKKGELLAQIDPVTYQATLDQALAKRNQDEALLANAKLDLERYSHTGPGVTAQKTIDTQHSQVIQYEAQLRSDAAAIASAQAYLDFTRITSPLDGRTGQRLVDEGNLVHATDSGLVVIAQIKPIQVTFTLPQQQLAQVMDAMKRGPITVEALDADDKRVLDQGALFFIDNAIDQTTGTVRMKAELPNEHYQLWPGQFTNVRVRIEILRNAIVLPSAAVQRGPLGAFVYVLTEGEKAKVSVRPVTIAQQDDRASVILKGISVGDKVVVSGFAKLKDGSEVIVTRTEDGPPTMHESAVPNPSAHGTPIAPLIGTGTASTDTTNQTKPESAIR